MARQQNLRGLDYEAGADLSAAQYTFMTLSSGQVVQQSSAGGSCVGVLRGTASAQGRAVTVDGDPGSVVKVVAGAAVAQDAKVSSDASGRAITAIATHHVQGKALTAAGAAGELIEVLLQSEEIL
jgi:hypothetical protein